MTCLESVTQLSPANRTEKLPEGGPAVHILDVGRSRKPDDNALHRPQP